MTATRALRALVFALGVSAGVAAAQNEVPVDTVLVMVEGEVLDALTGLPIPGVMVAMHDIWRVTWTDDLGYFFIENVPSVPRAG